MQQQSILLLFLSLAGLATIVFSFIYLSSKKVTQAEQGMANPLRKRFWFLLILFVILGIFASVTIPKSPYYLFADEIPVKVVHVSARQFEFILSEKPIDPEKPSGENNMELPVNELVEFRVTSLDVNHGFAIYDNSNRLITQVQAMPGYVNRLRYKFKESGKYDILCLEYCGMAHQVMRSSFVVK
jgi:cytochrome c oxidase subunit 2